MILSTKNEGSPTEFAYGITHTAKDGKEYDLLSMAAGIMFTESLFLKGIGLNIAIADAVGYGQRVGWNVGEKIKLLIKKPNFRDFKDIELEFLIVAVQGAAMHESGRSTAYVVQAATTSAFWNRTEIVNESFDKTSAEGIAAIAEKYLKTPIKPEDLDETFGVVNYIGNHETAFDVIDKLTERATSVDSSRLDNIHVMYNSIEGLKFRHLRTVLANAKTHSYVFIPAQFRADGVEDYTRVLSWKQQRRATIEHLIQEGVLRGSAITFDFKAREIQFNEFDYFTQHKDIMLMGTEPPIDLEGAKKMVESYNPQTFSGAQHTNVTPSLQAYDRPELSAKKYAASKAQKEMLESTMYTIAIHGNTDLRAGDIINISVPAMFQSDTDAPLDKWFNGKFLVGSVKHSIAEGEEYSCIVDLYKDAYETPLYD